MTESDHWYAFHTYRNSRKMFISRLQSESRQFYVAEQVIQTYTEDCGAEGVIKKPLFPSIVFVRCPREYAESLQKNPDSQVAPYTTPGTNIPAIIRDREMETFMFVLSNGCAQMDAVDSKLAKGDKVRVLDGILKGAEGYIVRIKGDRRFVVSINGIAAVATTYIPQRFLEKVTE